MYNTNECATDTTNNNYPGSIEGKEDHHVQLFSSSKGPSSLGSHFLRIPSATSSEGSAPPVAHKQRHSPQGLDLLETPSSLEERFTVPRIQYNQQEDIVVTKSCSNGLEESASLIPPTGAHIPHGDTAHAHTSPHGDTPHGRTSGERQPLLHLTVAEEANSGVRRTARSGSELAKLVNYIQFNESYKRYKSSKSDIDDIHSTIGGVLPQNLIRIIPQPFEQMVSPNSSSHQKSNPPIAPHMLSWFGAVSLTSLWLIVTVAFIGLEVGSGIVKLTLNPLRASIRPVSCEPLPENDGQLIHIDCPIRHLHSFSIPLDFRANIAHFDGIFFEMKVEMFQSTILPGSLRSSIGGIWSDHLLPSQKSWTWDIRKNPDFFPRVEGAGRQFGSRLFGGNFRLERPYIIDFHTKKRLALSNDTVYHPSAERPPTRVTSRNTIVYKDALYTGDPLEPQVGDIRITFYGSSATHLSAIGTQQEPFNSWSTERTLVGFIDPFVPTGNLTKTIVMEGDYPPIELMDIFERENDACGRYLVFIRVLTALISFPLFWSFLRLKRQHSIQQRSQWNTICTVLPATVAYTSMVIGACALVYSTLTSVTLLSMGVFSAGCAVLIDKAGGAHTTAYHSVPTNLHPPQHEPATYRPLHHDSPASAPPNTAGSAAGGSAMNGGGSPAVSPSAPSTTYMPL